MNRYLVFTSIGFELIGLMLGSIYLADKIDSHYQTGGVALAVLMMISLASWLIHVLFLLRRIEKQDSDDAGKE